MTEQPPTSGGPESLREEAVPLNREAVALRAKKIAERTGLPAHDSFESVPVDQGQDLDSCNGSGDSDGS